MMQKQSSKTLLAAATGAAIAIQAVTALATNANSSGTGPAASQANATTTTAAMHAPLNYLTAAEVLEMPNDLRLKYFMAMQNYLIALEDAQPLNLQAKQARANNWVNFMLPEAFALQEGEPCVIGGYFSRWYKKNGKLSCGLPENSSNEADKAPLARDGGNTQCGPGKMTCNPRVYGFDSKGARHCVSVEPTLSRNCNAAFMSRYSANDELLKMDVAKLLSNPQDAASYDALVEELTGLESQINDFGAAGSLVATQKVSVEASREPLRRMIEAARSLRPPQSHPPGMPQSPQQPQRPPQGPQRPPTTTTWPPRPPIRPPSRVPDALPRCPTDHPVLGRELSCVLYGLQATGHNPSERFLALIGTAVQHYNGPFDTRDEVQRKKFQEHVISMIQAYGYCDAGSYPAFKDGNEASQVRRWLTADNGNIRDTSGDYINRAAAEQAGGGNGQRRLGEIFGLTDSWSIGTRPDFRGLFRHDESEWKTMTLGERQAQWAVSRGSEGNSSQWKSCRENARTRLQRDDDFNLQILPGGTRYLNPLEYRDARGNLTVGSLPAGYEAKLKAAQREAESVKANNMHTCLAMAHYCGVSPGTCNTPTKTGTPGASGSNTDRVPVNLDHNRPVN